MRADAVIALLLAALVRTATSGRQARELDTVNEIENIDGIENFGHADSLPRFAESIPNVTVTVGKDALLACVVDNLKGRRVAWVRVDTQTILSIHHDLITNDPRISLTHSDHRSWYLHVKEVQVSDRGWYMCQVNTDPMRSRQGYLQVVVPPTIEYKETSTDLVVREMTNVTLTCKANGFPEPHIMWRREDGDDIAYNGVNVNVVEGEVLHLTRVSRLHMAAYLCIASNGVPPSISKRVQLKVQFPPMLSIPHQLEGAYLGQDVSIECHSEAYPVSINYWTTMHGDMIVSGDKYEAVAMDNGYNRYMMLKIRNMKPADFGTYKCIAKNSLGGADGLIRLDEIPAPTQSTSTTASGAFATTARKRGKDRARPLEHQEVNDFGLEEWRDSEYDDDEEYTLPSHGPHLARRPPPGSNGAPRDADVRQSAAVAVTVAVVVAVATLLRADAS